MGSRNAKEEGKKRHGRASRRADRGSNAKGKPILEREGESKWEGGGEEKAREGESNGRPGFERERESKCGGIEENACGTDSRFGADDESMWDGNTFDEGAGLTRG